MSLFVGDRVECRFGWNQFHTTYTWNVQLSGQAPGNSSKQRLTENYSNGWKRATTISTKKLERLQQKQPKSPESSHRKDEQQFYPRIKFKSSSI